MDFLFILTFFFLGGGGGGGVLADWFQVCLYVYVDVFVVIVVWTSFSFLNFFIGEGGGGDASLVQHSGQHVRLSAFDVNH